MSDYCCSCKCLISGEQFTLLDGRALCPNCRKYIKTGRWCADIPRDEMLLSEPVPMPPSRAKRMIGFLKGTDENTKYQIELTKWKQKMEQKEEEHKPVREFYHRICDYWPKDQPPDWKFRVKRAKKRAGNKCERCGQSSGLHVHHTLPRSQGGNHKPENLIVLCTKCHAAEDSPGHVLIKAPLSGDADREMKVVRELWSTALAWKSVKSSENLICSVCGIEIKKNEKHWEGIGWPEDVGKSRVFRGFGGAASTMRSTETIFIRRSRAFYKCKGCGKSITQGDLYFQRKPAGFDMSAMRYCRDCCYHRILCNYCDTKYAITRLYRKVVHRSP